ncbi:transcriptional regulator, AraC family [Pseudodesulfovibrio mercurii]|uniref:Transcriptional regulator, AraC family n=1 Tax=Pseudodesulfovibrio mercurii TaxID=641491 RepID=F0JD73_9BACT|nr:AraC family transcriptional regulator [Pseudodesulfovibrio mercurii]EGB15747.1 transcriptional regulator, AraC family [Pseudodesulfovibrio mercurii]
MADRSTEYREIPGLKGVGVVRHAGPPPTTARHAHRSVCVGAVLSGVRAIETPDGRREASAGQVLVIPSGLAHACPDAGESDSVTVSLAPACFETAGLAPCLAPDAPCVIDDPARFGDVLRLADLARGAASHLERQAALLAVMEPLCREGDRSDVDPAEPERIALVRRHLDAACAEDVRLEDLAGLAGCSPCRLNRLFARTVGMPPHEYQVLRRVGLAKACIRGGMGLAESAAEAGFSDQSHMTRCFRKVMGMTPGVFAAGVSAAKKG